MQMIIQISVSHGEECLYSAVVLLLFLKYILFYIKPAWKKLRAIMLENFCAKCMVFVNATTMSKLNISWNQNEFVTPGKTEIYCH